MKNKKLTYDELEQKVIKLQQKDNRNQIKLKKAKEKAKHISFYDDLTGLYNRPFFEEELKRLDKKRQLPLTILVGDLNNLKLINDVFNNKEGDSIIISSADIIKKACREEEIIARIGGNEYAILLPKTKEKEAEKIIRRINKKYKILSDSYKFPISISLGYATKSNINENINNILKEAEDNMYHQKFLESKSMRSSVISALEEVLREKSDETEAHSSRLQYLSVEIGKKIGFRSKDINEINLVAKLHDIGKTAIPKKILMKKGKLTHHEWNLIKTHPKKGYNIAKSFSLPEKVCEGILHHHERWDGKGYIKGLKNDEIPVYSQIISLVDSYDVMITGRIYKDAISKENALKNIKENTGKMYNPKLVSVFEKIIKNKSLGQGEIV
jgi:diguanylate cyclase (GGDEF)-like protein